MPDDANKTKNIVIKTVRPEPREPKKYILEIEEPEPKEPQTFTFTRETPKPSTIKIPVGAGANDASEPDAPEPTKSKSDKKTQYDLKYAKEKLKRIPLDVQKEKYEEIKTAADAAGETVNGFIKKAIDQRIERDSGKKS